MSSMDIDYFDVYNLYRLTIDRRFTTMNALLTLRSDIELGDWVMVKENNNYHSLIGLVTAIDKVGTVAHSTENETDDIHVDFSAYDYSEEIMLEIEQRFSNLYGEAMQFDELSLDNVIMAPEMLIPMIHAHNKETYVSHPHYTYETLTKAI